MPAMSDIILHHYPSSPFSEKVRICLGIKGLAWKAVTQPVIMPKPDLIPLTGGYRRIPVMQIGADIYCDSQLIVRELERRYPAPSLYPTGDAGLAQAMMLWTDRGLFQAAVALIFGGIGGAIDPAFAKDREALSGRPFDANAMKAAAPFMAEQLRSHLTWLDEQLADGRAFLTGDKPGLADANAYYNVWFMRSAYPPSAKAVDGFARLAAWEARVKAIGHGSRAEMSPAEAIAIARAATSDTPDATDPGEPNGLAAGDKVRVMADDYGRDPIEGVLVSSSAHHVAIRRSAPQVGDVVTHFPRIGYVVMKS